MNPPDPSWRTRWEEEIRSRSEAILNEGQQVRARLAQLVAGASGRLGAGRSEVEAVTRAVVEGSMRAAAGALPAERESVLREAVSGLGDGLRTAAQAAGLALQEARGRGQAFAEEDLRHLRDDLRAAAGGLAGTVRRGAEAAGGEVAGQAASLFQHAERTAAAVTPVLAEVFAAVAEQPAAAGREVLAAGSAATRQAAGQLFQEIGRRLAGWGDRLAPPRP
ncbi:MAG: DUF6781 family protein [Verrucomicrobiota bacterium]